MPVLRVSEFIPFGDEGSEGRKSRCDAVPQRLRPDVAVSARSGGRITQASGSEYQRAAQVLTRIRKQNREPFRGLLHALNTGFIFYLHAFSKADIHQSINHIRSSMGRREHPVSPFHHAIKPPGSKEVHKSLGRERMESRAGKCGSASDMRAEVLPGFQVGVVTAPLSSYHHFPRCTGHLLEQRHRAAATLFYKCGSGAISSHQSRGSGPYYHNI